jgi:LuxR family quorum sensing-dependent transcriptional regulator
VSATALLTKVPAFSILTDFTNRVADEQTPAQVLDTLNELTSSHLPLMVLGAVRIPLKFSDLRSMRLGKDVFLHASVPEGWWDEHLAITARTEHNPAMMMARSNLMTFTWTETMQLMDPVGIDRWPYEVALKYGIRDALICSLARRWMVVYWSRKVLDNVLTQPIRVVLFAAASFAALRLDQLTDPAPRSMGERARVTPREVVILRLVSLGKQTEEIATLLDLSEETVRTHLKKAKSKLGARSRAQAAAEAIRQQLIP